MLPFARSTLFGSLFALPLSVAGYSQELASEWGEALGSELAGLSSWLPALTLPTSDVDAAGPDADVAPKGAGAEPGADVAASREALPLRAGGSRAGAGARKAERASKAPHGIYVNAKHVLALAERGARPSGQPVPAVADRPRGIRLSGVASLGIGLKEGDVLTDVAGTRVGAPSEVVSIVLRARAARVPVISGRFFRDGDPWQLTVEQPYPEPKPERARGQNPTKPGRARSSNK